MSVSNIRAEVRGHWCLRCSQCQPWATWLGSGRAVCAPNHWTIKNGNLMCVFTMWSQISPYTFTYILGLKLESPDLPCLLEPSITTPPTLNPNLGLCGQLSSVVEWLEFPAPHTQKPEDRTTCPLPQTPTLGAKLTTMSSHAQVSFSQICQTACMGVGWLVLDTWLISMYSPNSCSLGVI